jgi:hypothetical protein
VTILRGICLAAARPEHTHFILDSFRRSLADLAPVPAELVGAHVESVERGLRGGIGRVVVATPIGHPETFAGWAAEAFGSLLFAYVPLHLRGYGIAAHMAAQLFSTGPVRLVYWTETAEAIREHGFPLVHDWREYARRERAAERFAELRKHHTERAA